MNGFTAVSSMSTVGITSVSTVVSPSIATTMMASTIASTMSCSVPPGANWYGRAMGLVAGVGVLAAEYYHAAHVCAPKKHGDCVVVGQPHVPEQLPERPQPFYPQAAQTMPTTTTPTQS